MAPSVNCRESKRRDFTAENVAGSHSCAHIFHFDPVKIGGLEVRPGDLPYGDRHGVLNLPLQFVSQVAAVAALSDKESNLISLCWAGQIPLD